VEEYGALSLEAAEVLAALAVAHIRLGADGRAEAELLKAVTIYTDLEVTGSDGAIHGGGEGDDMETLVEDALRGMYPSAAERRLLDLQHQLVGDTRPLISLR
jgi:hypothetical protein